MRKINLFGAGMGNAVGGLFGVIFSPLGWFTALFAVIALVGAFIAQDSWNEFYKTKEQSHESR